MLRVLCLVVFWVSILPAVQLAAFYQTLYAQRFLPEFYATMGDEWYSIIDELISQPVIVSNYGGVLSAKCRGCNYRTSIGQLVNNLVCGCCGLTYPLTAPKADNQSSSVECKKMPEPYMGRVIKEEKLSSKTTKRKRPIEFDREHEDQEIKRPKTEPTVAEPIHIQENKPNQTGVAPKKIKSSVVYALAFCAIQKLASEQLDALNGTLNFSGFKQYQLFLDCVVHVSNTYAKANGLMTDRKKRHNSLQRYVDVWADCYKASYEDLLHATSIVLQINTVYLYRIQMEWQKISSSN